MKIGRKRLTDGMHESAEALNGRNKNHFFGSSYRRNFEGYREIRFTDPMGKKVTQRTYVGDYYNPVLSYARQIELRILYILLAGIGIGLFVFSAMQDAACNSVKYVALFQALSIAMMVWLVYVMIFYVISPGKMTIGDYNTIHKPLLTATKLGCIFLWCCAGACLLSCALSRSPADLVCCAALAVSGLSVFAINWFESRLVYEVLPNDAAAPEDSVEIG